MNRFAPIYIAASYFLTGLVNLLPAIGALSNDHLTDLYAVAITSADLSLLLRHRAILLGIVGMLLVGAAFRRQLRLFAGIAGLVSMGSFVLLARSLEIQNPALQRVSNIDLYLSPMLFVAVLLHLLQLRRD